MNNYNLLVGITGGIGSGKSTVGLILQKLGFPVYYADIEAKLLMNTDPLIREELIRIFGEEAYLSSELNRPFIAGHIFRNEMLRDQMNSVVHPRVRGHFDEWKTQQNHHILFQESALLFETGAFRRFSRNILVTAPEDIRIQRVVERDGFSEEEVRARIANQLTDEEKIPLADFVINNDEKELVIPQVLRIVGLLESEIQSTSS